MNPFNLMPTGQPDKYPWLFTSVANAPKIPTFKRPGAFNLIAKDAFEVVEFLNLLGFSFTIPKYVDHSTLEGQFKQADINDPEPREYLAGHANFVGELNLAQVVDNLGGERSSPFKGLHQTMDEVKLSYKDLKVIPTDKDIVDALKKIFEG